MDSDKNDTLNDGEKERGPSYYHCLGQPLRMVTTGQMLDEAAQKWPDRLAVVSIQEDICLTFQQVKDQAERFGAGLLKVGLKPRDRIALLGLNTAHWYITALGATKDGLIVVMLNPAYRCQELSVVLKQVGARGIVTDHKYKTTDYYAMLADLYPGMSSAPHGCPLVSTEKQSMSFIIVATEKQFQGTYRWKDIMELTNDKQSVAAVEKEIHGEDPAYILFSSGSTGVPKPALLTHFGTINNTISTGRRMGFDKRHVKIGLQLPMFHIFGFCCGVLSTICNGATLVLPSVRFCAESTIEALQKYNMEAMYGTPTMYLDVCNKLKPKLLTSPKMVQSCFHVEMLCSGGSACPPELAKIMVETFPRCELMSGYGLTETSCATFMMQHGDSVEKQVKSIGYLMDHFEVKIVDRAGDIVPFGTAGEACFRGPGVLLEYWCDEEKTKEAKSKLGWLKTGDIMVLTEDGYSYIMGRIKDVIIRGGENIYPIEVENCLLQHPDISNAQVYGVTDERMGEEVAAALKLKTHSLITESYLREYCKDKMAHFKVPKYIRFIDEYPMTGSGKIQKHLLREQHEKELKEKNM